MKAQPTASLGLIVAAVVLLATVDGQLFSSSRFSSSGLVFPGPPAGPQRRKSGEEIVPPFPKHNAEVAPVRSNAPVHQPTQQYSPRHEVPSSNFRQASSNPNRPERIMPPVPLSLIGKQPEEFVAVAQRRQLQQQQNQQQQPNQRAPVNNRPSQEEEEDEEEEEEEPVKIQKEASPPVPHHPQPQQRKPEEDRPAQRRNQEVQRPESSIQQSVQQRHPNYPPEYKPRPQQANALNGGPRRPPPPSSRPDGGLPQGEEEEEEEEEPKPDRLQILLQKTEFTCADKKDGYYADEDVECEVFHYCQDRTRHSWLCPDGASFHQVHLICMPITRDNICKKSSKFHFVNDYLYRTVEFEDGSNSSSGIYADRYYPEGYEHGVPFDMEEVVHDRPNYQPFNRRQTSLPQQRQRPQHHGHQDRPQNRERFPNDNRKGVDPRRPAVAQFSPEEIEGIPFQGPPFRRRQDSFDRRGRPQFDVQNDGEEEA